MQAGLRGTRSQHCTVATSALTLPAWAGAIDALGERDGPNGGSVEHEEVASHGQDFEILRGGERRSFTVGDSETVRRRRFEGIVTDRFSIGGISGTGISK